MPAAADPRLPVSPPAGPGCPAAALAPRPSPGTDPPGEAPDDHGLLADLIGSRASALVSTVAVADLLEATPESLAALGLSKAARRRLLAGAELARRFQPAAHRATPCLTPRQVLPHLEPIRGAATEVLAVLALDAALAPLGGLTRVAEGGLMHVCVAAREVYAPALERRAAAIVLAHNHPSGVPAPSDEDRAFTRHMSQAGALLGIQLLDHLVVARRAYFSFAEAGLLRPWS